MSEPIVKSIKSERKPNESRVSILNKPISVKSNRKPITKNIDEKEEDKEKKVRAGHIRMGLRVNKNDKYPSIMENGRKFK